MVMRFPPKKNAGCPKAPHVFPPRKDGILYPRRVDLALPSPSQSLEDGRTYGRRDIRMDGHVTITSQPKFLGLIGYQISLAMVLRWRALPAGSAMKFIFIFELRNEEIDVKKILAVINATYAVAKRKPEIFQAFFSQLHKLRS